MKLLSMDVITAYCLCGFQLTGNTHQLPKHGCIIGLGLPREREENVIDLLGHLHQQTWRRFAHKCVSTHHWQLVEVQQLFDETSEHVLTLPHLIQGPESKDH